MKYSLILPLCSLLATVSAQSAQMTKDAVLARIDADQAVYADIAMKICVGKPNRGTQAVGYSTGGADALQPAAGAESGDARSEAKPPTAACSPGGDQRRWTARATVVAATQSYQSLVPLLGDERKAKVFIANLTNRVTFCAADEESAKIAADTLGKRKTKKRTTGYSGGKRTASWTEEDKYWFEPHELRRLRKFEAVAQP